MTGPPLVAGPHAPATATPLRSPGSVRRTTSIDTVRPAGPDGALVVDARVGSGFRRLLDQTLPAERDRGSLLYLLLDDLVGAVLVSGYALLRADALPRRAGLVDAMVARLGDQCAGWALDGGFIANLRDTGRLATPHGPPAPALASLDDDTQAWHATHGELIVRPVAETHRSRHHAPGDSLGHERHDKAGVDPS